MRVTQSMLSNNMLRNLSSSYNRLGKLQEQVYSGKKFTKPSDDPVAAMMGMNYRTDLNQIQQYSRNIGEAQNWVDSTGDVMDSAVSAFQRIRELTVMASNGTYDDSQRESAVAEIKELKEQLSNLGDTQVGGKYIFNGQNTNAKPSLTGTYGSEAITLEVFSGISIQVNTNGSALFGETLKAGGTLDQLLAAYATNDEKEISSMLSVLDTKIDQFLGVQSQIGARQNRIELMDARLSQQEVFATAILSKNEDIDIEKAIMDLTTQESVHSAALSVGSRVIQPSLLDFLR